MEEIQAQVLEEKRFQAWLELQADALDIIRRGYREIQKGARIFQLLAIPSFSSAVSIEAFLHNYELKVFFLLVCSGKGI